MKVTITAQDHPLYGRQVDICNVSSDKNCLKVILNLPDGEQLTIPSSLTDYFRVSDHSASGTLHLLDVGITQLS